VMISGGVALCTLLLFLCQVWSGGKIQATNSHQRVKAFHNMTDQTLVKGSPSLPESSFTESTNPPVIDVSTVVPVSAPESTLEPELTLPLFYRIPPVTIDTLSIDQQLTIVNLQNAYLKFFEEWNRAPGRDPEVWNQRMKDFHEEMVRQLGSDTVDSLVK